MYLSSSIRRRTSRGIADGHALGLEEVIRDAEREFIRRTKQDFADFARHNLVTMNESAGGEGPLGAKGPYFLYVLRSAG